MNKIITMKDIAAEMNVSVVSVSKALSGKDGVSDEVRKKIIEKAAELGYVYPSQQNSTKQVNGNIGILVADRFFTDNSFYSNMYRSLIIKSSETGFSSILEIITPENEKKCVLPNMISAEKVDGIIFMGQISENFIKEIIKTNLPYMLLDFYDEKNKNDCVVSDGISGAYELTKYLINSGHKKIGFVGNVLATTSILDRYLGYYKALIKNGVPLDEEIIIPDRDEDGRFIELNLPEKLPDAFVCNCDEVAYLLVEKLKAQGINIPDDISIVGFDDFRFATLCTPQLTTFHVDVEGMADAVISQLVRKIKRKKYTKGCTTINGKMIMRESVKIFR